MCCEDILSIYFQGPKWGITWCVLYKEGAVALRELVSSFQNLKKPAKHCASFSVVADARWNNFSFIFEGVSLHALKKCHWWGRLLNLHRNSLPSSEIHVSCKTETSASSLRKERRINLQRRGVGHLYRPKGFSRIRIFKGLECAGWDVPIPSLMLPDQGTVIKPTCLIWECKLLDFTLSN